MERIDGPRGCTKYEIGEALDLMNRVFTPQAIEMGSFNPIIISEANAPRMRIITVNGRIVAHAGVSVHDLRTGRGPVRLGALWAVATHPDYRRRGFGMQVVQDAMRVMRDEGCHLGWLGTGINDWYRQLDWENAGCVWTFTLDRATVALLPPLEAELGVEPWPEIAAMRALYDRHGLGITRSDEWFRVLLNRPGLTCYTASRGGELLAYILFKGTHCYEQAGDLWQIHGLLREAFTRADDLTRSTSTTDRLARFTVETLPGAEGLGADYTRLGLPRKSSYQGMYWLIDLPGLLDCWGLGDEICVHDAGDQITLTRDAESTTLSRRMAVKLLLGPERVTPFAPDRFPVPVYHWLFDWV